MPPRQRLELEREREETEKATARTLCRTTTSGTCLRRTSATTRTMKVELAEARGAEKLEPQRLRIAPPLLPLPRNRKRAAAAMAAANSLKSARILQSLAREQAPQQASPPRRRRERRRQRRRQRREQEEQEAEEDQEGAPAPSPLPSCSRRRISLCPPLPLRPQSPEPPPPPPPPTGSPRRCPPPSPRRGDTGAPYAGSAHPTRALAAGPGSAAGGAVPCTRRRAA